MLQAQSASRLFAVDAADDKQGADGQYRADGQYDPCVGDKARQQEADKGDDRDGDGVGQLRRHVVDVVALGTGGRNCAEFSEFF